MRPQAREASNEQYSLCAITIIGFALFTACSAAQELSSYRNFRFGARLESILSQTDMASVEAKTIHSRPALIQELGWRIRPSLDGSTAQGDSVKAIVFSFYNDQLFRIAVKLQSGEDGRAHRPRHDRKYFGEIWRCHEALDEDHHFFVIANL